MAVKHEAISSLLKEVVQKIKTEEDPASLNEIRTVFRKEVPFFLRSYAAAFLLKQMAGGSNVQRSGYAPRNERDGFTPRTPSSRPVFDEAVSSTIFISIGRNRRVFPRDLIALVSQIAGVDRDCIGEIRVLDNYSFVQLFKEDAEHAIQCLNEYEYRGRRLAVSYSRKKEDAAGTFFEFDDGGGSSENAEVNVFADEVENPILV